MIDRSIMITMLDMVSKKKQIAERLKAYRLRRQWTLDEMGKVTGLHLATISKIENGVAVPHDLTIAILEDALPGLFDSVA